MNNEYAKQQVIKKMENSMRVIRPHGVCDHFPREIGYSLQAFTSICKNFIIEEYSNGFYYGRITNGYRSGNGAYVFNNGAFYYGEWSNNNRNGDGIVIMSNGGIYIGEFKNGEFSGRGCLLYDNGIEVEGIWENDEIIQINPNSDDFVGKNRIPRW